MEETETKRGRGRPRKSDGSATKTKTKTKTKKTTKPRAKKKPDGRGGKREGAGRPKTKENPKDTMLSFRVSAITARRMKELRALTKDDTIPFVDMLEMWVKEMADDYGIE